MRLHSSLWPAQLALDGLCRFCVQPLAELVTATGRDILQATVDLVEGELGLEVRAPQYCRPCHDNTVLNGHRRRGPFHCTTERVLSF